MEKRYYILPWWKPFGIIKIKDKESAKSITQAFREQLDIKARVK